VSLKIANIFNKSWVLLVALLSQVVFLYFVVCWAYINSKLPVEIEDKIRDNVASLIPWKKVYQQKGEDLIIPANSNLTRSVIRANSKSGFVYDFDITDGVDIILTKVDEEDYSYTGRPDEIKCFDTSGQKMECNENLHLGSWVDMYLIDDLKLDKTKILLLIDNSLVNNSNQYSDEPYSEVY